MQKESEFRKMLEMCTMDKTSQSNMKVAAHRLGAPALKADNTMTFQFYLDTQIIVQQYLTVFMEAKLEEFGNARRELKKTHDPTEYDSAFDKSLKDSAQYEDTCRQMAHSSLYESIKIDRECFEKSHQQYSMDPIKRA